MKEILNIIHKTIYQFIDACKDDAPMSDKDKLLLEVNKAICNNLKALEQESYEDCISRQAAIDALNHISENYTGEGKREWHPHLDFMIDVIKRVPSVEPEVEKCEDCISRRDVIKMIESAQIISDGEYSGYCTEDINIDTLSSVTPEQKKGKWVDIRKDGNRIYRCRCSECGKDPIEYTYGYEDWWFEELPKFCPGCGAEMENEG